MKRRDFITLIGGAAVAASGAARAQQDRVRHVGVLMGYAEDEPDTQARMAAFRQALEQLGWKDGRNVQLTYRFGVGDIDRVHGHAKELVGLNPDLIVCETTPVAALFCGLGARGKSADRVADEAVDPRLQHGNRYGP